MRRAEGFVLAMFAGLTAVYAIHALSMDLWDDALFFLRFGHNLVAHGVPAWNVADGPVHGNTSQLFQLVTAALVLVADGHYHVAVKLFLAASIGTAFLAAGSTARRWSPSADPAPGVVLFCGLGAPTTLLLVSSGMETLFALAVLAIFLRVLAECDLREQDMRPTSRWSAALVALQVLVYLARPDMTLISVGAMVAMLWRPGRRLRDQEGLRLLLATVGALALVLLVLRGIYGTALPLSFYLKSRLLSAYDSTYWQSGADGAFRQLLTWVALTAPFLWVALFGSVRRTVGLVGPALAFVAYHQLSTLVIMGYHARFLQPAGLPIVLAAALAWPRFASGRIGLRVLPILVAWPALVAAAFDAELLERPRLDYYLSWLPTDLWTVAVGGTCLLLATALVHRRWPKASLVVPPLVVLGTGWVLPPRWPYAWDDAGATERIAARMIRATRGIDLVDACLPEPLHLYHSELGLPGVMFPESRITDLSGLMNPALAFSEGTFDEMCLSDPPDVLFLPHETHQRLNREIREGECIGRFARVPLEGKTSAPLYVRWDRMAAFEACRRSIVPTRRREDSTQRSAEERGRSAEGVGD